MPEFSTEISTINPERNEDDTDNRPNYDPNPVNVQGNIPTQYEITENKFITSLQERTGIPEIEHANQDSVFYGYDENGETRIEVTSDDQMVEDLSNIEVDESVFPNEEKVEMVTEAFNTVITGLGPYIKPELLQKLFPGIDPQNTSDYDFRNARLKIVVADYDSYNTFGQEYKPNQFQNSAGFERYIPDTHVSNVEGNTMRVNMNGIPIIVCRYPESAVQSSSEGNRENASQRTKVDLKNTVIHEILHSVELGNNICLPLKEGYTCLFTDILMSEDPDESQINQEIDESYAPETKVAGLLMDIALSNGVSYEDFTQALFTELQIGPSGFVPVSQNEFRNLLLTVMEQEDIDRFLSWGFSTNTDAYLEALNIHTKYTDPKYRTLPEWIRKRDLAIPDDYVGLYDLIREFVNKRGGSLSAEKLRYFVMDRMSKVLSKEADTARKELVERGLKEGDRGFDYVRDKI